MANVEDYVGKFFGVFRIDEHYARGAQAEVYLCRDTRTQTSYILRLDVNDDYIWDAEPIIPPINATIELPNARNTWIISEFRSNYVKPVKIYGVLNERYLIPVGSQYRVRGTWDVEQLLAYVPEIVLPWQSNELKIIKQIVKSIAQGLLSRIVTALYNKKIEMKRAKAMLGCHDFRRNLSVDEIRNLVFLKEFLDNDNNFLELNLNLEDSKKIKEFNRTINNVIEELINPLIDENNSRNIERQKEAPEFNRFNLFLQEYVGDNIRSSLPIIVRDADGYIHVHTWLS